MSRLRPALGCKGAPSAAQPRALDLDVLPLAAVSLLPAAQQQLFFLQALELGSAQVSPRYSPHVFHGPAAQPHLPLAGPRLRCGRPTPPRKTSRPERGGRLLPAAPPLERSGAAPAARRNAEGPPATWRGRSRPASGAGAAAFGRAMSCGRTALGAIAWLCLLVAAAEGLRRRGPSVTAKVTPGRAGNGRSVALHWGGPRAAPVSPRPRGAVLGGRAALVAAGYRAAEPEERRGVSRRPSYRPVSVLPSPRRGAERRHRFRERIARCDDA